MDEKRVETFDPSEAAAVATTMTMPVAITPYSMAVTPVRSTFTRSKRESVSEHPSAPCVPGATGFGQIPCVTVCGPTVSLQRVMSGTALPCVLRIAGCQSAGGI